MAITQTYNPYINYNPYQLPTTYPNYNYSMPAYNEPKASNNVNVVWISDEKEVANYPIAPNNAVVLWDDANKKIYLKSADATGKPSIKTYSLAEENVAPKEEPQAPAIDTSSFVSTKAFEELRNSFESVKKELESMKSDMYGIAGKKASKK